MGAVIVESGSNPMNNKSTRFRLSVKNEQADAGRDGRTCLLARLIVLGANEDREKNIFPVQVTTSRIGNLTQLIHTLAISN